MRASNGSLVKLDADYDLVHWWIVVIWKISWTYRNLGCPLSHHLSASVTTCYLYGNYSLGNGLWKLGRTNFRQNARYSWFTGRWKSHLMPFRSGFRRTTTITRSWAALARGPRQNQEAVRKSPAHSRHRSRLRQPTPSRRTGGHGFASRNHAGSYKGVVGDLDRSGKPDVLHLALASGTDLILFNALMTEIAAKGWLDRDFIGKSTTGFGAMVAANKVGIAEAARVTGLKADDIRKAASWIAEPKQAARAGARCSPTKRA